MAIRQLWSETGAHILQAPIELCETAGRIGFALPTLEARGYAALEARVTTAYDEFVDQGSMRSAPNPMPPAWTITSSSTGR